MIYWLIFINAIVVALMAMYVYENERKMEKMSTRHDLTENQQIAVTKRITEVENQLLQSNEKGSKIRPAFHASMVRHPYTFSDPNEILRFETVWTNIGDGYHSNTGVFNVPRDGLYQIMGTLWSTSGNSCAAYLYKNDLMLNYGYAGTEHAQSNTVHALVILKKDDKIYFKNRGSTSYRCHGNYHSEFSGWFVHE